ncbi:MAG: ribosome biogenesis GTPase Der, partial [Cellulosilyticaceae bacterium]
MSKPIVAIIGRPNVGKSTLFNRLAKARISIVDDQPGVTRDRIYADVEWLKYKFTMIDTGGIEPESADIILNQMRRQAEAAIASADVIMFIVDVKTGLTDSDMHVANMLRKSHKPVVLVVNKVDDILHQSMGIYEFYNLGLGDPIPVSAGQALNLGDMLDAVVEHFPDEVEEEEEDNTIRVAIIGKPNVGKSSLVNKIVGEERVIVSEIAGTTRDSVDTEVIIDGQKYNLIDTAGLRKKKKVKECLEKYSIVRTVAAVERADIILILIDAEEGITEQDTK